MELQEEQQIQRVTLIAPIYNANHVRLGTFLGGPLIAGYFIAENYKVFGEYGKAKAAWIYAIAATIVIFGGIFLIPETAHIPNYVIPIAYCWIAYYLTQHFQGAQITAHAATGEGFFGWGRVVLISLIGLAVTIVFLAIAIIATDGLTS
ncbi:hypothetical protein IDJ75_03875 [Mucilaginibacter rigui]|uniref:Uncharacterized protein n=1 Tax=Mucilaginibacter rigui TaxID=534635 RepID=A0ABR7X476_9SPHI|nr:hypothetical protein [Mucilaginibacter rigui]MBD1384405.1 hypothetical protein [Mucilaginibacter rigui]